MFDLMAFAQHHRYRVRNLHDGRPLHPLRVPVGGRTRSDGYVGDSDRMDAIIGQHGYVTIEDDRSGWYVFAKSCQGINRWLPKLEAAGAVVHQEGDDEAAGDAPVEAIGAILSIIKPFGRASRPDKANSPLIRGATACRINAMRVSGM